MSDTKDTQERHDLTFSPEQQEWINRRFRKQHGEFLRRVEKGEDSAAVLADLKQKRFSDD